MKLFSHNLLAFRQTSLKRLLNVPAFYFLFFLLVIAAELGIHWYYSFGKLKLILDSGLFDAFKHLTAQQKENMLFLTYVRLR